MKKPDRIQPGARKRGRCSRRSAVPLLLVVVLLAAVAPAPVSATDGFSDVAPGNVHAPAVTALAERGVLAGTECGDGRFCPHDPIERSVMAVWLIRVLGASPDADSSRFADVDASQWWSPFAEELADRGVTRGCATGPLRFCPDSAVTRAQMASFLVRAFDLESAGTAGFTDTGGSGHRQDIDALAAAGITSGCATGPLRYCPDRAVTRAQMATFLHRALLRQEQMTRISDDVPDVDLTDLATGESVNLRSLMTGDKAVLLWFWAEW